ncbi:MAG: hypothetical protein F3745_05465 [Nitrospinae bacterium]|nr:hypothetical protein [Nitrospinota bacterium]
MPNKISINICKSIKFGGAFLKIKTGKIRLGKINPFNLSYINDLWVYGCAYFVSEITGGKSI